MNMNCCRCYCPQPQYNGRRNVGRNRTFHTTETCIICETGEDRHLPTINGAVLQEMCLQEGRWKEGMVFIYDWSCERSVGNNAHLDDVITKFERCSFTTCHY